jgi:hypothetical protein
LPRLPRCRQRGLLAPRPLASRVGRWLLLTSLLARASCSKGVARELLLAISHGFTGGGFRARAFVAAVSRYLFFEWKERETDTGE